MNAARHMMYPLVGKALEYSVEHNPTDHVLVGPSYYDGHARPIALLHRTPHASLLQDHIGAAGLVVNYFAGDEPQVISSRRTRWVLRNKNESDPNTVFGNTRGVPLPEWYQEDVLEVGGLRFVMDRPHIHEAGDYLISLNKTDPVNANAGIYTL